MPIYGLTDKTPSFKEIGRLRLGIPKAEALRGGPRELGYFRPDFRPDAADAAAAFAAAYKEQPTEINIRLPFAEIVRCWDANYEVYNTSGLLGMADGEKWLYLRDNKTSALLVKDGVPANSAGLPVDAAGMPYMPFDKAVPVYSYHSDKHNKDVPVFAAPTGRLKVLIPELRRAAYVLIVTHSIYNIIHITEQLGAISAMAQGAGMSLPLVPMILTRRKEKISVSINGKKAMQEKYLLNIEVNRDWMGAQWQFLDGVLPGASLPAQRQPIAFSLPANIASSIADDGGGDADEYAEAEYGEAAEGDELSEYETLARAADDAKMVCTARGTSLGSLPDDKLAILAQLEAPEGQELNAKDIERKNAAAIILKWHRENAATELEHGEL